MTEKPPAIIEDVEYSYVRAATPDEELTRYWGENLPSFEPRYVEDEFDVAFRTWRFAPGAYIFYMAAVRGFRAAKGWTKAAWRSALEKRTPTDPPNGRAGQLALSAEQRRLGHSRRGRLTP